MRPSWFGSSARSSLEISDFTHVSTSQGFFYVGRWFGNRVIATTVLDRLLQHALTLDIRRNSYRLNEKLKASLVRSEEAEA